MYAKTVQNAVSTENNYEIKKKYMVIERNMNEKVDTKYGENQNIEACGTENLRNFKTHLSKVLHFVHQKAVIIREFATNSRHLTSICRPKTAQTARIGNEMQMEKTSGRRFSGGRSGDHSAKRRLIFLSVSRTSCSPPTWPTRPEAMNAL